MGFDHLLAQGANRVEWERLTQRPREGSQNRPIFTRVARRESRARGSLDAALRIHVKAGFFRIGGARQDNIGAMRPAIAMRADIDDEGARRDIDFVGAEIEQKIECAGLHKIFGRKSALLWRKAKVKRANPRRRRVQHGKAIPAVGKPVML